MAHLPCLGRLSLGSLHDRTADTEVSLTFVTRANGVIRPGEDMRGEGASKEVAITVKSGKEALQKILDDLKAPAVAAPPDSMQMDDPSGEYAPVVITVVEARWNQKFAQNMLAKASKYEAYAAVTKTKIIEEHERLNRLTSAARQPLEIVKAPRRDQVPGRGENNTGADPSTFGPPPGNRKPDDVVDDPSNPYVLFGVPQEYRKYEGNPMAGAKSESSALNPPGGKDKWDIIDTSTWEELIEELEAEQRIIADARLRTNLFPNNSQWRGRVARFKKAVAQLLKDYASDEIMLTKVAEIINAFYASPEVANNMFVNMIIMGNPGTGKSRLAGQIGNIIALLGIYVYEVTEKRPLVVASSADFIAGYVGQTQMRTRSFLNKNRERCVFLDEAYSLMQWDKSEEPKVLTGYSPEAVDEMTGWLSEHVGELCFICAGYEHKMILDFIEGNEGLARRFPLRFTLRNYPPKQMIDIFYDALSKALRLDKYSMARVERQPPTCSTYFTQTAIELLKDVILIARETTIVDPRKLLDEADDLPDVAEAAPVAPMAPEVMDLSGSSDPEVARLQNLAKAQAEMIDTLQKEWKAFESKEVSREKKIRKQERQARGLYEREEPTWSVVSRLFEAEAGSMVNLANLVATSLAASPEFVNLGRPTDTDRQRYATAQTRDESQTDVPNPDRDRAVVGYEGMFEMLVGAMREQFSEVIKAKDVARPASAPVIGGAGDDDDSDDDEAARAAGDALLGRGPRSASGPSSASTAPPPEAVEARTERVELEKKWKPAYEVGEQQLKEALSRGQRAWMVQHYDRAQIYWTWKQTPRTAEQLPASGDPVDIPRGEDAPVDMPVRPVVPNFRVQAPRRAPPQQQRLARAPGQFDRPTLYPDERHAGGPRRSTRVPGSESGGRRRTRAEQAERQAFLDRMGRGVPGFEGPE